MIESAAVLACVILFGLSLFQAALISGAPIGKYAWGGNNEVLPLRFRVGSFISILLYVFFALTILSKAGLVQSPVPESLINTSMWILSGYFMLGVLMNAMSRSKSERVVMTPVALILAILYLFVSFS